MELTTLFLLGTYHGINPGMGWLFAVGLGLQEQRRSAVWVALLPLALGHALAIGAAILIFALVGSMMCGWWIGSLAMTTCEPAEPPRASGP